MYVFVPAFVYVCLVSSVFVSLFR